MQPAATTWRHHAALAAFCIATVLLIPLEWYVPGLVAWAVSVALVVASGDARLKRNMGLLLAAILMLAFSPINTERDTRHFITLGIPFAIAILGPAFYMRWKAPGEMNWQFFPRSFSLRDTIYVLISIPLSWAVFELYFFHLNPELPTHWPMPAVRTDEAVHRLVIGINCVGIWDELFFVNTVYVLLRGLFPAKIANPAQAVVYTAVLYDMAFTGAGIVIVYLFALTQGVMYDRSGVLLYVLLVHIIVDVFLVLAILHYHYPGYTPILF